MVKLITHNIINENFSTLSFSKIQKHHTFPYYNDSELKRHTSRTHSELPTKKNHEPTQLSPCIYLHKIARTLAHRRTRRHGHFLEKLFPTGGAIVMQRAWKTKSQITPCTLHFENPPKIFTQNSRRYSAEISIASYITQGRSVIRSAVHISVHRRITSPLSHNVLMHAPLSRKRNMEAATALSRPERCSRRCNLHSATLDLSSVHPFSSKDGGWWFYAVSAFDYSWEVIDEIMGKWLGLDLDWDFLIVKIVNLVSVVSGFILN